MNRPTHKPVDANAQRKSAKRTAFTVIAVAVAVYIGFMVLVWMKHHS